MGLASHLLWDASPRGQSLPAVGLDHCKHIWWLWDFLGPEEAVAREISSSVFTMEKPLVKLIPGRERRGDKGLQRCWSNRHSPVIRTAGQQVSKTAGIAQKDYGMGQEGEKWSGILLWCPWCYFLRLDGYEGQQREFNRVSNAQQVGLSPGTWEIWHCGPQLVK